jgi:16S rRNA (cytosine967-C5)-methyltransferase
MNEPLQPRKAALSILHRVRGGDDSDAALDAVLGATTMERRDKAFAMALAMGVLRYGKVADALLASVMQKTIDEKKAGYVADVLRLGVVQLLWLNVPAHAAVHSSVELVKASKFRGFAKLVNGVLQRINRESGALLAKQGDIARLATPDWLWQRWLKAYGEERTAHIAAANLQEPALDISVKSDAEDWAQKLNGEVLPTGSVRLPHGGMVTGLEGFESGAWWVQDAAAAIPARLFGNLAGKQVLDLCAAPGGKTAQLAAAGGDVVALDRSGKRLQRVRENLARLGLDARLVTADILEWHTDERFDAILLDAPCTATGTLRRHPDVAWRKSDADVAELAGLQRQMLLRAIGWLKPGGVLVYSTCSLEREEGEDHIEAVTQAAMRLDAVLAAELGGMAEALTEQGAVRCLPTYLADKGGMDGFFAARFIKC